MSADKCPKCKTPVVRVPLSYCPGGGYSIDGFTVILKAGDPEYHEWLLDCLNCDLRFILRWRKDSK